MNLETDAYTGDCPLYSSLRRAIGRADQDWEDRVHDTILWLLDHPGVMLDADGNPEPVREPIGLAVSHVKGRIRNARRRAVILPHVNIDAKTDGGPSVAEKLMARDRADARAIIVQALRKISPAQRAIVRLTLSGYTVRDIAARIGSSKSDVSRMANRAMKIMAE